MQGNKVNAGEQPTPQSQMQQAYATAAGNQPAAQAQPQAQAQAQAPVGGGMGGAGGLRGMMMGRRAPMSKDTNGRVLTELTKKLQDYYNAAKDVDMQGLDVKFLPVPRNSVIANNNYSNQISLLIVAVGYNNRYAYHTLLIASEMPPAPTNRTEQYGYQFENTATAPRTATALADDALAQVIRQKVSQSFPQSTVYSADWETVPDNFRMNDTYAIEDLFLNALKACWQELLSKETDFAYDSLSAAANDMSGVVSIHMNQDQANPPVDHTDKVGNPLRSEIVIDFRSEQPRTAARDVLTENTANVVEFGQAYLYVTLGIDPVAARQNQWNAPGSGANETQEYVGEVTFSGIDLAGKVDLANVLLMISTALPIMDFNSRPWLRNFLPKHLQHNGGRGGQFRPRDLGALNYDYKFRPQGQTVVEPFNTMDENAFGMEEFNFLTNNIIQAAAALSIDVPECGDQTWFLRPFAEANTVQQAYDAIVKAVDGMTDNKFSPLFFQTASKLITLPRAERILNGFFIDETGQPKDLRTIDMLYMLNRLGHEDPEIGRKWAATFGGSTDQQLAARAKLIEQVASNVTYTGISIHKTFHPDFLISMDRAIAATGLKIRNELSREDSRMMVRPSAGLAQAGALMAGFQSSVFVQQGAQYQGGGVYRDMAHIRRY